MTTGGGVNMIIRILFYCIMFISGLIEGLLKR